MPQAVSPWFLHRSTSSELRRRSLQLAMKVLEMEDELLWPCLGSSLFLVVRPGAPSSVLAPSSDARSP